VGKVFGHRKWVGLWVTIFCVMAYPFVSQKFGLTDATTSEVLKYIIAAYGLFVTGNFVTKFAGGSYGKSNQNRDNNDPTGGAGE